MKMRYFSSSYAYARSAFAVIGLRAEYDADQPLFSILCVAKNLIQRGCPTPPSPRLVGALGGPPPAGSPRIVDATHRPSWARTIQGSDDGNNPALRFWHLLCELLPDDLAYMRALILPEASIARILEGRGRSPEQIPDEFADQHVDFFCPIANLVIEIDGSQHERDPQRALDKRRDRILQYSGTKTLRISTSELGEAKRANAVALHAIEVIRARLEEAAGKHAANLTAQDEPTRVVALGDDAGAEAALIHEYETALRLQATFLELMLEGELSPTAPVWHLDLQGDVPRSRLHAIARAATADIFDIVGNLCALVDPRGSYRPPRIAFAERGTAPRTGSTNALSATVIDVSAFRTWDEADLEAAAQPRTVIIRSAHDLFRNEFELATAPPIRYRTIARAPADIRAKTTDALRYFLKLLFGHDEFRPGQLGIICRALARRPTLGILPTGLGKSMCYQMACLLQPALSFVVCPIMSLMQDQERSLRSHGIDHVARLDSQMTPKARAKVRRNLSAGRFHLVWVSPERFQDRTFRLELREVARKLSFGYAVLDEVHCLSEWGHDFRVSYLLLNKTFRQYCSGVSLLGLTATASQVVLTDLKAELRLTSQDIQTLDSLNRPELRFHIRRTTPDERLYEMDKALDEVATRHSETASKAAVFRPKGEDTICGIVFANTRAGHMESKLVGCEEIKDHLWDLGIPAETYHSGRAEHRTRIQERFMNNEFPVMVATKSFGMGIDKSNVRFTIHAHLPWSIEAFYQEAGRAGRSSDNASADCFVLYVPDSDPERVRRLFSRATTVDAIHRIQPELEGDLSAIFFLWGMGYASFAEELRRMLRLVVLLEDRRTAEDFATIGDDAVGDRSERPDQRSIQTEKALYKLSICGLVRDWTRDWNLRTITVELSSVEGFSLEQAAAQVEAYIARHSPGFSIASPRADHRRYVESYRRALRGEDRGAPEGGQNESQGARRCAPTDLADLEATTEAPEQRSDLARLGALLGMLLMWTNENIVYARRAAIGNMLALCESELDDEQVGRYIESYFKLDTKLNDRLEHVARNPDDVDVWLDVFYRKARRRGTGGEEGTSERAGQGFEVRVLRKDAELADIVPITDRFREAYPTSIGLEWVSLMARLLTNSFDADEVVEDLTSILRRAAHRSASDAQRIRSGTESIMRECGRNAQRACKRAFESFAKGGAIRANVAGVKEMPDSDGADDDEDICCFYATEQEIDSIVAQIEECLSIMQDRSS